MYAIIDIETTGGSPQHEKITEIAVYLHDGARVTGEFISLINPERFIPRYITQLTGITNEMVEDAPKFFEIAKELVRLTENRILVAHNATFDYNFIRWEFKHLGYDFKREKLCTVKLSRKLIPGFPSYSLGNLCKNLGIAINGRHRAAGDAYATVRLFELLLQKNNENGNQPENLHAPWANDLHPHFNGESIKKLPEETGIYYFHNEKGDIIYIGKSKNIRDRVITHFSNKKTHKAMQMKEKIVDISYEVTGNELIALLLEASEIKKHQPAFNRLSKKSKFKFNLYNYTDDAGYIRFRFSREDEAIGNAPLLQFTNEKEASKFMYELVERYQLCQKLSGLYNSEGSCFHYKLGICKGACNGSESPEVYNARAYQIVERYSYSLKNFLIIDKGREQGEKSVVRIANGRFSGFGFAEANNINGVDMLHDCIKPYPDNRDMQQVIMQYLRNQKVERIIPF